MKVTQETLPDSQVGLEIEVPGDVTQQTYEQMLRKYMQSANIPGFRKGKVPRQVLIQRLGPQRLKASALEELVQNIIEKAVKAEDIEAIGNYQLVSSFDELITQFEPGKPIILSASVDVPPRITLAGYDSLSVQAEEVKYDSEKVSEALERYRENMATLVPVEDRPAEEGDVAVVDFVGKVVEDGKDPEEFEGGSAEEFQVEIKEGRFIPGFVEGIVGMKLEETKDVEVTFPDNYPQEELAGKPAVFTITLNDLKERELPELDDDFAEEVSEFETLDALKTSLVERYQKEAEDKSKANTDQALLDALAEKIEAEIPKTLVQREVDHLVTQTVMQFANQGIDVNKFLTRELVQTLRENAQGEAVERLKRTLALSEVAKQESLTVEDDAVTAKIDEIMADVEDPASVDQNRLQQAVHEDLLKEQILGWLSEKAAIELVPEGTLAPDEAQESADAGDGDADDAAEAVVEVEAVEADAAEE